MSSEPPSVMSIPITPEYVEEAFAEFVKLTHTEREVPWTEEQTDSLCAHIRKGITDMGPDVRVSVAAVINKNDVQALMRASECYRKLDLWGNVIVMTAMSLLMTKNRHDLVLKVLEEKPCASA